MSGLSRLLCHPNFANPQAGFLVKAGVEFERQDSAKCLIYSFKLRFHRPEKM